MTDIYKERVAAGSCGWCDEQADRTVCFETCDHAEPCCAVCFALFFDDDVWPILPDTELCVTCFA